MSLDVYLKQPTTRRRGTGVYVRENGQTRELTWEEVREKFPDFDEQQSDAECEVDYVFDANITHNLGRMARAVHEDFYKALWRPEELVDKPKAKDLSAIVSVGLLELESHPEKYRPLEAENGWGRYDDFVPWVRDYLEALVKYPEAEVSACR